MVKQNGPETQRPREDDVSSCRFPTVAQMNTALLDELGIQTPIQLVQLCCLTRLVDLSQHCTETRSQLGARDSIKGTKGSKGNSHCTEYDSPIPPARADWIAVQLDHLIGFGQGSFP